MIRSNESYESTPNSLMLTMSTMLARLGLASRARDEV